jgi:hypothetical protein
MTTQNYLIIESNVVTNAVLWDGNPDTWQPPSDSIQLVQATTPALVWVYIPDSNPTDYILQEVIGAGAIGFTWNTTTQILTTNEPKPEPQPLAPTLDQPSTTGTQTA